MASEDGLGAFATASPTKNALSRTDLHNAVGRGDEEAVRQLLQSKADLDAKDGSGWTPLHLAAQEGHLQIIESLLKKKASTEATDGSGLTPVDVAIHCKQENAVRILRNPVPKVARGSKRGRYVMLSGRFNKPEIISYIKAVKKYLDEKGIETFMVQSEEGESFAEATVIGLHNAWAMIAFGTDGYGAVTGAGYETYFELKYAYEHGLLLIPIQLCQVWPPEPTDHDGGQLGRAQNSYVFSTATVRLVDKEMQKPEEVAEQIFQKLAKEVAIQSVERAMDDKNIDEVREALEKAISAHVREDHPQVQEAQAWLQEKEKQDALKELSKELEAKSSKGVSRALKRCEDLGAPKGQLEAAKEWLQDPEIQSELRKLNLLQLLEKDPEIAASQERMKKEVPDEALAASKRILIIGDTGAGKSAFCGLLDGSLQFVDGQWESHFQLGHGGSSLTNEPKLLAATWCGQKDGVPILLMDTPGLGDSRGPEVDDKHMAEVARWINCLESVHGIVILLTNATRVSRGLRTNLDFFQKRFGLGMWDHTLMVVNRWAQDAKSRKKRKEGKLQSAEQFQQEFREVLQRETARDAERGAEIGVGLSQERADRVPFFFIDTHFDREDDDEIHSMNEEMNSMKLWLMSVDRWKVRATTQSPELRDLISAVQSTNVALDLQKALQNALNIDPRPSDLTNEKIEALQKEIDIRFKLEHAQQQLEEAWLTLHKFSYEGRRSDAEIFLQKIDALVSANSIMSTSVPGMVELRQFEEILRSAFQGEDIGEDRFPKMAEALKIRKQVSNLAKDVREQQKAEAWLRVVFERWNFKESSEAFTSFAQCARDRGVDREEQLRFAMASLQESLSASGQEKLQLLSDWYTYISSPDSDVKIIEGTWRRASAEAVQKEVMDVIAEEVNKAKEKLKKDEALKKLKEAIRGNSIDAVERCLSQCKSACVPEGELKDAEIWLEVEKKKEATKQLKQAMLNGNSMDTVRQRLQQCISLKLPQEDLEAAEKWLQVEKKKEQAVKDLKEAMRSNSIDAVQRRYSQCKSANVRREELEIAEKWLEEKITKQLKACELRDLRNVLRSFDAMALPSIASLDVARKVSAAMKEDQTPQDIETFNVALSAVDSTWKLRAKAQQILEARDAAEAEKYDEGFIFAAEAGNVSACRGWVAKDPSCLKVKDDHGHTALHFAAAGGDSPEVMRFLLQCRCNIEAQTRSRATPLHYAAANGQFESVKVLLAFRADVRVKDEGGRTPMDLAKEQNRTKVVKLLAEAKK